MLQNSQAINQLNQIQKRKIDMKDSFSFSDSVSQILEERENNEIENQYNISKIPKWNGKFRTIEAPREDLKAVQQRLLRLLNQAHVPKEVHWFRKNSWTIQWLRQMLDSISKQMNEGDDIWSVFQTDLKDFFPSVKADWVEETVYNFLFRTLHRSKSWVQLSKENVSKLASLITELSCLDGRLAQWAPTSPVLSNIVWASRFDGAIMRNLSNDMQYWRYADDIVIMWVDTIPQKDRWLVISILESAGFQVAKQKTEYYEGKSNLKVWGLNVITKKQSNWRYSLEFKLPKDKEKLWAKEILDFIQTGYTPKDSDEFSNNTQVKKIFWKLWYAYSITKAWNYKQRFWYFLPKELAFAWNIFVNEYWNVMTENMKNTFWEWDKIFAPTAKIVNKSKKPFFYPWDLNRLSWYVSPWSKTKS